MEFFLINCHLHVYSCFFVQVDKCAEKRSLDETDEVLDSKKQKTAEQTEVHVCKDKVL